MPPPNRQAAFVPQPAAALLAAALIVVSLREMKHAFPRGVRGLRNDDLSELKKLEDLRFLSFEGANAITDEGLAHLSSLKLKQLELVQLRKVTDAGLAHTASIETLESLNLSNCEELTNAAIPHLKRLPKLKQIKLGGTRIDPQAFQAAIPNCEIVR
jgi:hypothetical protein